MRYAATVMKVVVSMLMLIVAGCGGGGGGADNNSGTLAISVTSPTIATPTGTVTATYTDPLGRNPQGLEISFSTDRPDIVALDDTKESVGSNGQAMVTFRTITPATDTSVKLVVRTGDLQAFQYITVSGGGVITPPPVGTTPNSISFDSASPTSITLKGTGGAGRVETSIVSFIVKDTAGLPLSGQIVDFSLNTTVGGLTITPTSATSDSAGVVKTIVNAGVVSTPVRVTATVRGTLITTQSDQLTVTTGIPDQDSVSVSAGNLNSETYNHDGVAVPITVILSDHFNNPVPNGTVVNFTTNAGQIVGSGTTNNGAVTVNWVSSAPRIPLPSPKAGRFVVLAYAVGEESFTDLNGNGVADSGEFVDSTEAFRDDNFNAVRDLAEPFIDFDGDGVFNTGDGKFNGLLQGAAYLGVPRTMHVFKNIELVMSTDAANIIASPASLAGPGNITVTVRDLNGNTMAAGSTVVVEGPGFGTLSGTTSYTVPQNIGFGQSITFGLAAGNSPTPRTGNIKITVTSNPGGLQSILLVPVTGNF